MPGSLNLGTVRLRFSPPALSPAAPLPEWTPTDAAFLADTPWAPESREAAEVLLRCLSDSTLGATLEHRLADGDVVVRVSVVPNDGGWRTSPNRVARLKALFPLLERGWESGREMLLQPPVSLVCEGKLKRARELALVDRLILAEVSELSRSLCSLRATQVGLLRWRRDEGR